MATGSEVELWAGSHLFPPFYIRFRYFRDEYFGSLKPMAAFPMQHRSLTIKTAPPTIFHPKYVVQPRSAQHSRKGQPHLGQMKVAPPRSRVGFCFLFLRTSTDSVWEKYNISTLALSQNILESPRLQ